VRRFLSNYFDLLLFTYFDILIFSKITRCRADWLMLRQGASRTFVVSRGWWHQVSYVWSIGLMIYWLWGLRVCVFNE